MIAIDQLRVSFGDGAQGVVALDGVSLDVAPGELVCLLGPSGCGKSTLLNAVAGFVQPSSGSVSVDGRPVRAPGPDRAMVFQEYALFPWMTVAENLAFGLRLQRAPAERIEAVTGDWLSKLSLTAFRKRFPKDLSGGMRQRVAIGRALALDAPVLLMDEPFGALDALTRRSLQDQLLRILAGVKKAVLFVTHSIEESLALADRIAVMTYRPGTIKRVVEIPHPKPRDLGSPELATLAREVTALVMEEERRHQSDETATA